MTYAFVETTVALLFACLPFFLLGSRRCFSSGILTDCQRKLLTIESDTEPLLPPSSSPQKPCTCTVPTTRRRPFIYPIGAPARCVRLLAKYAEEKKKKFNEMEPSDGQEAKMERGRTHARSASQLPGVRDFTHQRRRLYASQLPRVPQEEEEDPFLPLPECTCSSKGAEKKPPGEMKTIRQLVESSMHLSVGIPCTTSMGQLAPIALPNAIRPTRSFEDHGTLVEDVSPDELDKKMDKIVKEYEEGTGIFALIKNPKAKVTFSESVKVEPVVPDPTSEPAIWVLRDDYVSPRVPRGQRRLMPGQYEYETHMREMGYEPKWDEESERTKREWNHRSQSEPPPERKSSKLMQMLTKK